MVRPAKKGRNRAKKVSMIEPRLKNRRLPCTEMPYQCQQRCQIWPIPADLKTGHRDPGLRQRLCQRTRLQQRNHFILELIAIHRRDQIDQAALGTTGVETGDQMADANRQNP
jgi:hypothetical protein